MLMTIKAAYILKEKKHVADCVKCLFFMNQNKTGSHMAEVLLEATEEWKLSENYQAVLANIMVNMTVAGKGTARLTKQANVLLSESKAKCSE